MDSRPRRFAVCSCQASSPNGVPRTTERRSAANSASVSTDWTCGSQSSGKGTGPASRTAASPQRRRQRLDHYALYEEQLPDAPRVPASRRYDSLSLWKRVRVRNGPLALWERVRVRAVFDLVLVIWNLFGIYYRFSPRSRLKTLDPFMFLCLHPGHGGKRVSIRSRRQSAGE